MCIEFYIVDLQNIGVLKRGWVFENNKSPKCLIIGLLLFGDA